MTGDNNYFINYVLKRYLGSTIIVLLEVSSISFYNTLIVGKMLGSEALAVMSLTSSFSFLYYMFGCLINIGAAIAASVALGQNDYQKVGKLERFAFYSSIVVPLVISLLLLMVMHPLLIAMGADESMYELSKSYVRITLLLGFVYTLMYFLFNFLRVDGRSKLATRVFALMEVLDFVSVFLVMLADLLTIGVMYLYAGWMRRRDENLTGVLMLDKRMEEGDFLSVSVSAAKGSEAEASEKIAAFCEENELPPKLAMGIPLAVEEILNIMSEKCFHNDDSKYSDVRIVKKGEDILICVRCGGECFNPMEWYKDKCETLSFEERLEDPSLGMKLLNDISKKITFNRTLGVNNLLVLL